MIFIFTAKEILKQLILAFVLFSKKRFSTLLAFLIFSIIENLF